MGTNLDVFVLGAGFITLLLLPRLAERKLHVPRAVRRKQELARFESRYHNSLHAGWLLLLLLIAIVTLSVR